jgi:hypothetical protein
MSLPALESYIAAFGDARSKILPAVAENWKRGERVVYATKIPAPMLEMNMMTGDALIHVRDEWFGWLHYTFTREAAREFGQALIALADAPAPPIAGRA